MHEIICPHCGKAFKIDEAGYADILKQVRDSEFEQQLHERLELAGLNGLSQQGYFRQIHRLLIREISVFFPLDHRDASIAGCIVHDNNFISFFYRHIENGEYLPQERTDVFRLIMHGHDKGDMRMGEHYFYIPEKIISMGPRTAHGRNHTAAARSPMPTSFGDRA